MNAQMNRLGAAIVAAALVGWGVGTANASDVSGAREVGYAAEGANNVVVVNDPEPVPVDEAPVVVAITLGCAAALASPHGAQALIWLKIAKQNGVIRNHAACMGRASDAGQLAELLGGPLASLVAGYTARCACDEIF